MKHAILITAYKDISNLVELVSGFDDNYEIYIHLDAKVYLHERLFHFIEQLPQVKKIGRIHSINWGGRNHIDAILWLCRQALMNTSEEVKYFHLVSGGDLLIKRTTDFCRYFEDHAGKNFLDYFSLPYKGWTGGGLNRLAWRHPLDRLDLHDSRQNAVYNRYIRMQTKYGSPRDLPEFIVYGGSSWWSLTREAVSYICANHNYRGWYDRLEDTFAPDEMYVQTLLLNSPLKETVANNNLRHILWEYRNGNCPAVLDKNDISALLASEAMFARKVDSHISRELITFFNGFRNKQIRNGQ